MTLVFVAAAAPLASPAETVGGWWTEVTAGEWLTAGVGAVAALVVAIQSFYTRRSAEASKDALKVANDALAVAAKEEGHSRSLVIEAHRARIDAALPKIDVSAGGESGWLLTCRQPEHGEWKSLNWDTELALPGDRDVAVAVGSRVLLHNGSERVVEVDLNYTPGQPDLNKPPAHGQQVVTERRRLMPGQSQELPFWTWTTLGDWISGGAPAANHGHSRRTAPIVTFSDPSDSSADIEWRLTVDGLPFERLEHKTDAFTRPRAAPSTRVHSEIREYWLSKSQGVPLDAPAID